MKRCFNFTMAAVLAAAMLATGCGGNGSGTTDVLSLIHISEPTRP